MTLTLKEKDRLVERLESHFKVELDKLMATDRGFFAEAEKEATELAKIEAGIESSHKRSTELDEQIDKLKEELNDLRSEMKKRIQELFPTSTNRWGYSPNEDQIIEMLKPRHIQNIYDTHETGRLIIQLNSQKESLIDKICLMKTPTQHKEVWAEVDGLFKLERTLSASKE